MTSAPNPTDSEPPMPLYRAVCHATAVDDHHVFIEARNHETARLLLPHLLALVWRVPVEQIQTYNDWSEQELLDMAIGHESDGTLRLLEAGFGPDGPNYVDPARTLLWVGPGQLPRLVAALGQLQRLQQRPQEETRL